MQDREWIPIQANKNCYSLSLNSRKWLRICWPTQHPGKGKKNKNPKRYYIKENTDNFKRLSCRSFSCQMNMTWYVNRWRSLSFLSTGHRAQAMFTSQDDMTWPESGYKEGWSRNSIRLVSFSWFWQTNLNQYDILKRNQQIIDSKNSPTSAKPERTYLTNMPLIIVPTAERVHLYKI